MCGIEIALILGIASALLVASDARAHVAGSPPITESGSFALAPAGQDNSSYHTYVTQLGIPAGPGDTLRFAWSANAGLGPPVDFEIHAHPNATGFVLYYRATAARVDDAWSVPGPGDYMVLWDNRNPASVNVTYTLQLIAPTDLTPLLAFPAVLGGLLVAVWVDRRRRARGKQDPGPRPDPTEDVRSPGDERPSDPREDRAAPPPR